jgi:outer membrane receptor protein involved in Fe transport
VAGGVGNATLSYYYQSSETFDPFGDTSQGGYGVLDAQVSWTDPSNKWTFSVYGRNLTDTTYLTQVFQESEAWPQTYGEPISFGVQVQRKF